MFLDTIKYFYQSLGVLASSLSVFVNEKKSIRTEKMKILLRNLICVIKKARRECLITCQQARGKFHTKW